MAHILNLPHLSWVSLDRINAAIRAVPRAVAAEHELALRASNKAALPRRCLAEVQAMYVSSAPATEQVSADRLS